MWFKKFVNSYFPGGKAYGTGNPEVRKIAKTYLKELKTDKSRLIDISKELWNNGYIESRIVASIFIGSIIDDSQAIRIVKKWVPQCNNWVNTDILMAETKEYWAQSKDTIAYSKKLMKSKNPWDRRFGLIILIWPVRRGKLSKLKATSLANTLKDDKEKYVKKGYIWLMDQINKYHKY